jgi:hypothetical protein
MSFLHKKVKSNISLKETPNGGCKFHKRSNYPAPLERLYLECPETLLELKQMTKTYINRYNWNRGHQSLHDQTPASVYHSKDSL